MMHHSKKWVAAAAIAAAAVLAMTGCAGGGASDSKTEVTVWHYWDGTNADTFDSIVKSYNENHSNVTIKSVNVPNADFLTKVQASARSKTLPTMVIGDLIWVPQIAQIGTLADLSKSIPSDTLSDINPALTSYGSQGGKQVSVPVSANNLGFLYNTDLFKQAGLDPTKPPTTWDELIADGKTILQKTGKPGYELFTHAGDNGEGLTWDFQVNLWQAGGQVLNDDNTKAAFNTSAGKKALQYWADLIKDGVSPFAPWGAFEKGAAASAQEGSWMVGIWANDPPFPFASAPIPYPSDGKPATNLGGEQAMVFDGDAAATKAAGDFLAWFLQPKQVTSWSEATGMLPVTNTVATSDDYLSWVDGHQPLLRPYVEQMADARARPNTPLYSKASFAFAQEIEKVLAGQTTVSDGLDNAEAAVNKILSGS
jgi:multiple sugar transport system substrate-binding protein